MNLLIVSSSFPPETGGIQNLVYNYAMNSSHSVEVLTVGFPEGWKEFDDEQDFEITRIRNGRLSDLRLYSSLLRKSLHADVIYFGDLNYPLGAAFMPVPYVVQTHGRELLRPVTGISTGINAICKTLSLRFADKIISNSDFTKRLSRSRCKGSTDVDVIHPGVDNIPKGKGERIREKLGISSEDFLLLTVSRLDERKGQDLVIEAIKDLEDIEYIIAGDGEEREYLETLVEKKNLDDRVHIEGYIEEDELKDYYDACDVFIMPSKFIPETGNVEGFGIVYLEAGSLGKPVIGSNTGGIPSAIKEGETGLLCDTRPESVKEKILQIKENPELRDKIGNKGKKWAQEHNWKKTSKKIDECLKSLF